MGHPDVRLLTPARVHLVTPFSDDARRTYFLSSLILEQEQRYFLYSSTMIGHTYPSKFSTIAQPLHAETQSSLSRAAINLLTW